jgi:hypothetical protein
MKNSSLDRRHWFTPQERDAYRRRTALEREATKLLANDRRRRSQSIPAPRSPEPEPVLLASGWLPFADLKRAMRAKSRGER